MMLGGPPISYLHMWDMRYTMLPTRPTTLEDYMDHEMMKPNGWTRQSIIFEWLYGITELSKLSDSERQRCIRSVLFCFISFPFLIEVRSINKLTDTDMI